ncbi:hypothetical protein [Streptomyces sp. NPDC054784]
MSEPARGPYGSVLFVLPELAVREWEAVARLFRPRFVEVSGCVVWEQAYEPANFRSWCEELAGDRTSVERVLNQVRLWQFVEVAEGDPEEERAVRVLAEAVAAGWRSALEADFPGRSFDGGVVETGEDGPVVCFTVRRTPEDDDGPPPGALHVSP